MASKFRWMMLVAAAIFLATIPMPALAQSGSWQGIDGAGTRAGTSPTQAAASQSPGAELRSDTRPGVTRVSTGKGALPNEHGQLWREYNISPYTLQVASTNRPEQALIDWILQETGYEAWHSEALAVLCADRRVLYAYHTPEMQKVVKDVVDRFVSNDADASEFVVRVITVNSPNWRARVQQSLQPVPVQTPGVQAWLLEREAAVNLVADLQRRSDFREHNSPQKMVNNGQSTVVSVARSQYYVRDVRMTGNGWPGYQPETAVLDEGFSLEFSPLLSVDQQSIDGIIECKIDHVEKMVPVMLDVPTAVAPRQRTKVEVPQLAQFQFHERFRWASDKVLLVGMGMVPMPLPTEGKTLVPGLPIPMGGGDDRGDLLVLIESKPATSPAATSAATAARPYPGNTSRR